MGYIGQRDEWHYIHATEWLSAARSIHNFHRHHTGYGLSGERLAPGHYSRKRASCELELYRSDAHGHGQYTELSLKFVGWMDMHRHNFTGCRLSRATGVDLVYL